MHEIGFIYSSVMSTAENTLVSRLQLHHSTTPQPEPYDGCWSGGALGNSAGTRQEREQ